MTNAKLTKTGDNEWVSGPYRIVRKFYVAPSVSHQYIVTGGRLGEWAPRGVECDTLADCRTVIFDDLNDE